MFFENKIGELFFKTIIRKLRFSQRGEGRPIVPLLKYAICMQYDRLLAQNCRLSVCLSVTLCIVALRVGVRRETIVFLAGHFLFTSSDTFTVGCIVYPQNTAIVDRHQQQISGIKSRLQFETVNK